MTVESLPVEKFAHEADAHQRNPMELDNIAFMSTNVVSGTALAPVVATGHRTYFGALAQRLASLKVVVKRLDAIQNFGAMNMLCTDKTGTLTQDKIALARHTDAWDQTSREVLELAYLNSYHQTGLKNMLDVAVLDQAQLHHELQASTAYTKVDEVPFDFERRACPWSWPMKGATC